MHGPASFDVFFVKNGGRVLTEVIGKTNKLAPCGTGGRLFSTDVSANFKVT